MYHANKSALFLIAFVIFVLVFVALYIWIPNDNAKPLKKEGQTFNNVLSLKGFIRNYQLVLKDKLFMYLIIGSSILLMGELSTSSYVSIRLKRNSKLYQCFMSQLMELKCIQF